MNDYTYFFKIIPKIIQNRTLNVETAEAVRHSVYKTIEYIL